MRLLILILATAQLVAADAPDWRRPVATYSIVAPRLPQRPARRRRPVPLVFRWPHRSLGPSRRRRCGYSVPC